MGGVCSLVSRICGDTAFGRFCSIAFGNTEFDFGRVCVLQSEWFRHVPLQVQMLTSVVCVLQFERSFYVRR